MSGVVYHVANTRTKKQEQEGVLNVHRCKQSELPSNGSMSSIARETATG